MLAIIALVAVLVLASVLKNGHWLVVQPPDASDGTNATSPDHSSYTTW